MARRGMRVVKDNFARIRADMELVATNDGPESMRIIGRRIVPLLIARTPKRTGAAASGWIASARALKVGHQTIEVGSHVVKRGRMSRVEKFKDKRKVGENLGRYIEKRTKKRFAIRMQNAVKYYIFIERGARYNPGRFVVKRTMDEQRGKFGPLMSRAFSARGAKLKRKL